MSVRHDYCGLPSDLRYSGRSNGLLRLKAWIAEHGALSLTLKDAAGIACMEPSYFSKHFRKHVGIGFKEWRRRLRVSWAVAALERGIAPLPEIIRLSGYRNRRAFERAVKRITGMTPTSLRRLSAEIDPGAGI